LDASAATYDLNPAHSISSATKSDGCPPLVLAALALTRVMSTMLVGVKASDPVTYVAMAVLFFGITALACWMPGRRAAGLDPLVALRDE
jgi:hypothetical protein